jgi:hypothetical protein
LTAQSERATVATHGKTTGQTHTHTHIWSDAWSAPTPSPAPSLRAPPTGWARTAPGSRHHRSAGPDTR